MPDNSCNPICPDTGKPCNPYECNMLSPECQSVFESSFVKDLSDPYDEVFK